MKKNHRKINKINVIHIGKGNEQNTNIHTHINKQQTQLQKYNTREEMLKKKQKT